MPRDLYELIDELWVPQPRDRVFEFFSEPQNLDDLTPPWLRFSIVTPRPVQMRAGALIDYRLRVHGLPMRWRSEITVWEPPYRFVDEQRHGPYRVWRHEHAFTQVDGGTLIRDHVRYAVPGWIAAPLVHRLIVRRDVRRIFDYRRAAMLERFGGRRPAALDAAS